MAPLALPAPRDVTPEDQRAALPWLSAKDRRLVKRAGDSTEPIEPRIAEALEGYLESQYDLAADGVAAATGSPAEIVDQLGLDLGSGIATLMRRFYRLLIGAAWVDAGTTLALDLVFDLENPLIQTVLGQLARRVTRVAETTREEIRALVGLQAAEGWSVERLAREIRAAGVTRCPARARLIAATETAEAYSLGSKAAYQEAGVVTGVRWLTTEDACPICSPLNGKTAPLDGDFGGGISHPPAHPGCRCAIAPVL
jgi:SPP1 gp7 family putative phage head morphogenesis protein